MNLDALLKPGRLPWSPNPGVGSLDVWSAYEHPLAGTFRSGRDLVLFMMLADFDGRTSVWAYTCLPKNEATDLTKREFASVEELREFVEELLGGRRVALALAEDLLIKNWSISDSDGPILERADRFLDDLLASMRASRDPGTALRTKLAQVDAASELVDA
jgi:hypothetical protein